MKKRKKKEKDGKWQECKRKSENVCSFCLMLNQVAPVDRFLFELLPILTCANSSLPLPTAHCPLHISPSYFPFFSPFSITFLSSFKNKTKQILPSILSFITNQSLSLGGFQQNSKILSFHFYSFPNFKSTYDTLILFSIIFYFISFSA